MAFTAKTLYGFTVASGSYIHGCQSMGVGYGSQPIALGGDGSSYATFLALASQDPVISIETAAIKSALTAVGVTGAAVTAGALYFQNFAATGFPASGAAHDKVAIASGLVVPTSLTLSEGAAASIGYAVYPVWNGTDDPLVLTTGQSLPTDVPIAEAYTLGPVKIGATLLDCVQSVTVDFGLSVVATKCNGAGWPTHLRIAAVRPSIRVQTAMPINMSLVTLDGSGSDSASAVVSARAFSEYGMHVAAATAGHITVTAAKWMAVPGDDAASMGGLWSSDFTLVPGKKAATAHLAVSTAAALPS